METPWGPVAVSDAHVHFFSHSFFAKLGRQKGGMSAADVAAAASWELPPEDPAAFAAKWVHDLDRHGVERAAIIASLPGDEQSVLDAVRLYPTRFFGYFMVNPLEQNAVELVRSGLASGLKAVCLFPAMHGYSLHDDRSIAVIAEAARAPGSLVFVHCGVLTVGIRRKIGLPSPFDLRFSNPVDLHGIALRFPSLTFVIPHFGAGYFREALMVADLCPNVMFDTSSSNSWVKYQPEPITLLQVFERALNVVGPGRLLFGTDSGSFPKGWKASVYHEQVALLRAVGLSGADAAMILGGNLERLLHSPENVSSGHPLSR